MTEQFRLQDLGEGRPTLVFHGGPGPAGIDPLIGHLSSTRHVLAPTHPGWDGTELLAGVSSVPGLAALYAHLIAARDLTAVALVGTSFGGWVAAELATQLTQNGTPPAALVLIDSIGADVPGYTITTPKRAGTASPGVGPSPVPIAALAAYTSGGLSDPELLPKLSSAPPPTLLIWGEADPIAPLGYGTAIADALRPASRLVVVPGAGHTPYRDNPEMVFEAIDNFLDADQLPN